MQSKRISLIEAVTSTIIGAIIATTITITVFDLPLLKSVSITSVLLLTSTVRAYLIRRIFNKIKNNKKAKKGIFKISYEGKTITFGIFPSSSYDAFMKGKKNITIELNMDEKRLNPAHILTRFVNNNNKGE